MRLESVQIENYGGIRFASLNDLDGFAVITITGRNGTGKSLFLEAVAQTLSMRGIGDSPVGAWGKSAKIELVIKLESKEQEAVSKWLKSRDSHDEQTAGKRARICVTFESNGSYTFDGDQWLQEVLQDYSFREDHPFLNISFLPAVRAVRTTQGGVFELAAFDSKTAREAREQGMESALSRGEPFVTPSVSSQLSELDYMDLLAERSDVESDELSRVIEVFESTTGKKILRPQGKVGYSVGFEAELIDGATHSVNKLSSGERAMLSLLFYVRRVAAQGGLLLIDEPEQHLHPTLVGPLMASMVELAPEAQILVVTHAAGAIAAANDSGIIVMEPPRASTKSQLRLIQDVTQFDLLEELGISAGELLGVEGLVIVEGPSDEQFLRTVFPGLVSRLRIIQAGGVKQALKYSETLSRIGSWIDWICIIDRDLRSDSEVEILKNKHPSVFVWAGRDLESVFLQSSLIASAYQVVGVALKVKAIESSLCRIGESLRGEVVSTITRDRALSKAYASQEENTARPVDVAWLRAKAKAFNLAADYYENLKKEVEDEVARDWGTKWPRLVDPKVVLQQIVAEFKYFNKNTPINSVLTQRLVDEPSLRPEELQQLGKRMEEMVRRRNREVGQGARSIIDI